MLDFGTLRLVSLCLCMAPLTLAVMVMRGLVSQQLFCMVLISGSYLVCLCERGCPWNLSW